MYLLFAEKTKPTVVCLFHSGGLSPVILCSELKGIPKTGHLEMLRILNLGVTHWCMFASDVWPDMSFIFIVMFVLIYLLFSVFAFPHRWYVDVLLILLGAVNMLCVDISASEPTEMHIWYAGTPSLTQSRGATPEVSSTPLTWPPSAWRMLS